MAIAFRAASAGSYSLGTVTIAKPSGTAAGDILVAFISTQGSGATPSPPSGWTLILATTPSGRSNPGLSSYWHLAAGGDPASWGWGTTATNAAGGMVGYSGVDTTSPIVASAGQNASVVCPSVTPGVTDCYLVCAAAETGTGGSGNTGSWTAPSGMTDRSGGGWVDVTPWFTTTACFDLLLTASTATGTKTPTNSTAGPVSDPCAHSIALVPSGGGGGGGGFSTGTTETFNATTSWTVPSKAVNGFDVTQVNVACYGGGGGGGAASATSGGGGGGGGGFSQTNLLSVTPGEVITITVGAGGAAAGGPSWFRSTGTIQALGGGAGGAGGLATGGTAGAAAGLGTGTTRFSGGAGAAGNSVTTGGAGGGGAGNAANGGAAATTTPGTGGSANGGTGGVVPTGAGQANGGGGGGGTSVTGTAGGAGSRGQVLVNYLRQWASGPTDTAPTQPAAATVARAFVGARAQSETTPTQPSTATVSRVFTANRAISVTVGAAAASVARVFVGARTQPETNGPAADSAARAFVGARTQTDSVGPAAASVARVFTANRTLSETVGPAADTASRIAAFNRARSEATATQPALDSAGRVVAAARTRSETVGPAAAAVSRVAQYNRILGEGPGDYPANNGQKSITGIVRDEDSGAPVAGVTVYLIRSPDLVYTGQSRVTAGDGSYTFLRDFGDANSYLVLVKTDGDPTPRHGVSDEGLVPS